MRPLVLALFLVFTFTMSLAQDTDTTSYETVDEYVEATDDNSTEQDSTYAAEQAETPPQVVVDPKDLQTTRYYKDENIAVKKFDQKKLKEITGSANYEEKPEEPDPAKKDFSMPKVAPWGGAILRLLAYVIIIGVIVALIYFVLKNISIDLKIRKENLAGIDITAPVENIEDLDTQALLAKALQDGNLKLAVRLYYLRLLQKLNENGIIHWKKDKTNRDYLSEIFSRDYHYEEVKKLTLAYELVWYGDHTLSAESFQGIIQSFETVHQKINIPIT
jgi:hypothetical protein